MRFSAHHPALALAEVGVEPAPKRTARVLRGRERGGHPVGSPDDVDAAGQVALLSGGAELGVNARPDSPLRDVEVAPVDDERRRVAERRACLHTAQEDHSPHGTRTAPGDAPPARTCACSRGRPGRRRPSPCPGRPRPAWTCRSPGSRREAPKFATAGARPRHPGWLRSRTHDGRRGVPPGLERVDRKGAPSRARRAPEREREEEEQHRVAPRLGPTGSRPSRNPSRVLTRPGPFLVTEKSSSRKRGAQDGRVNTGGARAASRGGAAGMSATCTLPSQQRPQCCAHADALAPTAR